MDNGCYYGGLDSILGPVLFLWVGDFGEPGTNGLF
jgi:hypothetical protein